MMRVERNLYKWTSHPYDIDGYWQFWTDARGDRWSLKTFQWAGRQPRRPKKWKMPKFLTEEDVRKFATDCARTNVCPYCHWFFHPTKKQVVKLTNETKRLQWLREKID